MIEQAKAVEAVEQEKAADSPVMKKSGDTRAGSWLIVITLLVVTGLAAAGYYLIQQLREQQAGLGGELSKGDKQINELTQQTVGLRSEITALRSQLAELKRQFSAQDKQLESALSGQVDRQAEQLKAVKNELQQSAGLLQEQLNDFKGILSDQASRQAEQLKAAKKELQQSVERLQHQLDKTHENLLMADAEYLIRAANQRLRVIGDVKTALAALEGADRRLKETGDPALFEVRKALAEEIARLKNVQAPDLVGISSRLLALEDKAKELPLFLPHAGKAAAQAPEKAEGDDSGWQGFKDLIVIRRTDQPVDAVLAPEEAQVIRHALVLKLETARIAAMRGDEALYQRNLNAARDWLAAHFDREDKAIQAAISEIESLQQSPVEVRLPQIGRSLELIEKIPSSRLQQPVAERP